VYVIVSLLSSSVDVQFIVWLEVTFKLEVFEMVGAVGTEFATVIKVEFCFTLLEVSVTNNVKLMTEPTPPVILVTLSICAEVHVICDISKQ
jgi:hypothetical protein